MYLLKTILAEEEFRGPYGHFVEALIKIPHPAYVFDAECNYHPEGTSYLPQAGCAIKLIGDFIRRLKETGHYDESTIIIHADHGKSSLHAGDRPMKKRFVRRMNKVALRKIDGKGINRASSVLLLIKPANHIGESLTFSDQETQLVDIPATIYDVADIPVQTEEGISIFTNPFPTQREVHIFEGYRQDKDLDDAFFAFERPRAKLNHYSYTKGKGWLIYPKLTVINE